MTGNYHIQIRHTSDAQKRTKKPVSISNLTLPPKITRIYAQSPRIWNPMQWMLKIRISNQYHSSFWCRQSSIGWLQIQFCRYKSILCDDSALYRRRPGIMITSVTFWWWLIVSSQDLVRLYILPLSVYTTPFPKSGVAMTAGKRSRPKIPENGSSYWKPFR